MLSWGWGWKAQWDAGWYGAWRQLADQSWTWEETGKGSGGSGGSAPWKKQKQKLTEWSRDMEEEGLCIHTKWPCTISGYPGLTFSALREKVKDVGCVLKLKGRSAAGSANMFERNRAQLRGSVLTVKGPCAEEVYKFVFEESLKLGLDLSRVPLRPKIVESHVEEDAALSEHSDDGRDPDGPEEDEVEGKSEGLTEPEPPSQPAAIGAPAMTAPPVETGAVAVMTLEEESRATVAAAVPQTEDRVCLVSLSSDSSSEEGVFEHASATLQPQPQPPRPHDPTDPEELETLIALAQNSANSPKVRANNQAIIRLGVRWLTAKLHDQAKPLSLESSDLHICMCSACWGRAYQAEISLPANIAMISPYIGRVRIFFTLFKDHARDWEKAVVDCVKLAWAIRNKYLFVNVVDVAEDEWWHASRGKNASHFFALQEMAKLGVPEDHICLVNLDADNIISDAFVLDIDKHWKSHTAVARPSSRRPVTGEPPRPQVQAMFMCWQSDVPGTVGRMAYDAKSFLF